MTSAPHWLVNVYGQWGLGFGAPWSLVSNYPILPLSGGLDAGGGLAGHSSPGSWPRKNGWVGCVQGNSGEQKAWALKAPSSGSWKTKT